MLDTIMYRAPDAPWLVNSSMTSSTLKVGIALPIKAASLPAMGCHAINFLIHVYCKYTQAHKLLSLAHAGGAMDPHVNTS